MMREFFVIFVYIIELSNNMADFRAMHYPSFQQGSVLCKTNHAKNSLHSIGCEVHLHKHLISISFSLQVHDVYIEVHPSFQMHMCEVGDNNNNNLRPTFDFVIIGLISNFLLTFLYFFENAPTLTPLMF